MGQPVGGERLRFKFVRLDADFELFFAFGFEEVDGQIRERERVSTVMDTALAQR